MMVVPTTPSLEPVAPCHAGAGQALAARHAPAWATCNVTIAEWHLGYAKEDVAGNGVVLLVKWSTEAGGS